MNNTGPEAVLSFMEDRTRRGKVEVDVFTLTARAEAAEKFFGKFDEGVRVALRSAASNNSRLLCALGEGRWAAAVRLLKGMELRVQNGEYVKLARELEAIMPNVLDAA